MGVIVHARNTPDGIRYRLWYSSGDRYSTEPLPYEEMRSLLQGGRLARFGPLTLVEARSLILVVGEVFVRPGAIGRVEKYPEKGAKTTSVRWFEEGRTEHAIRFSDSGYELDDERLLVLGNLVDEAPEHRLDRAKRFGSSALDGRYVDLASPWETERCLQCSLFHHSFDPKDNGICRSCGEGEADISHRPPCPER